MRVGLRVHAPVAERKTRIASGLWVGDAWRDELADAFTVGTEKRKEVIVAEFVVGVVHFAEVVALKVEWRRTTVTPVGRDQEHEATRRNDGTEARLRDEAEAANLVGLASIVRGHAA